MAVQICPRFNCSALSTRRRKNVATARSAGDMSGFGVRAGDGDRRLSRMLCPRSDRVQQQWPAGDGFQMPVGLGQSRENVPPVVNKRDEPRAEAAPRQIVRGEPAPAPLVLQLVENILVVAAIPVQLAETFDRRLQRRRQNLVFVKLAARGDVGETQLLLTMLVLRRCRQPSVTGRRSTITRRCRPQPSSRTSLSLAPSPGPRRPIRRAVTGARSCV